MSKQNDGGAAFPLVSPGGSKLNEGMSLRDWFAGKALQGLLADPTPFEIADGAGPAQIYAEEAYIYADAMLAARKKP